METNKIKRLSRDDWIHGAFKLLGQYGIQNVKIVPLAEYLGATSGSFYWHFKNRRELYDALLDSWEQEMTDAATEEAKCFIGTPEARIWRLMENVMTSGLARYDLAIWHWAQSDTKASRVFKRVIKKRFSFAAWMFTEAGFSKEQAEIRGRMMVIYMMGESTFFPGSMTKRMELLKLEHSVLSAPE